MEIFWGLTCWVKLFPVVTCWFQFGFLFSDSGLVCLRLLRRAIELLSWAGPPPLPALRKVAKDWGVHSRPSDGDVKWRSWKQVWVCMGMLVHPCLVNLWTLTENNARNSPVFIQDHHGIGTLDEYSFFCDPQILKLNIWQSVDISVLSRNSNVSWCYSLSDCLHFAIKNWDKKWIISLPVGTWTHGVSENH